MRGLLLFFCLGVLLSGSAHAELPPALVEQYRQLMARWPPRLSDKPAEVDQALAKLLPPLQPKVPELVEFARLTLGNSYAGNVAKALDKARIEKRELRPNEPPEIWGGQLLFLRRTLQVIQSVNRANHRPEGTLEALMLSVLREDLRNTKVDPEARKAYGSDEGMALLCDHYPATCAIYVIASYGENIAKLPVATTIIDEILRDLEPLRQGQDPGIPPSPLLVLAADVPLPDGGLVSANLLHTCANVVGHLARRLTGQAK
jgi:hypothetical protein